uniref:TAR DNA-binding protein 43 n=2 Tax=Ascaris TaxID=6251 RepID=F1L1W8_ASCSU
MDEMKPDSIKSAAVQPDSIKSAGDGNSGEEKCDYVVVTDSEDGDRMELPTHPEDGSLGLSTLTHAYPGAQGLKFKNPQTGASRALLVDASGTRFMPPAGGWNDKVFFVIYPQRSSSDQNPKRKKMMDECEEESGSEDTQGGYHGSGGGQLTAKQKRIEEPTEKSCVDLIVLGISYKATEETVKAYFETFGEVLMFDLKRDAAGNSKGFGFVRMKDYDAQLRVLAKCHHEIDGRRCEVKIPLSKGEVSQPLITRVFLGRVPESMTADDLRSFFNEEAAKYDPEATVTDVYIPRPFRSFAFINISSADVATRIISKGDYVIKGSSIAVCAAAPRDYSDYSPRLMPKGNYTEDHTFPRKIAASSQRFDSYSPRQGANSGRWESGGTSPGAYRSLDSRVANRFSPGYASSAPARYAASMQQRMVGTSQALASGLDALNLNKMNVNPEMMDAAWHAFWTTLNSGAPGSSSTPSGGKW